jgi:HEAT repeat protein
VKNIGYACLMATLAAGCHAKAQRSNPSEEQIPNLIQELKSGDDHGRAKAAEAIGRLGPEGKPALPALLLALRDEGELVRQNALRAIIAIGPDARAIDGLTIALRDSDDTVRALSASALGGLGPLARRSIPALREAMQDRDENVQKQATDALNRIDPSSVHRKM